MAELANPHSTIFQEVQHQFNYPYVGQAVDEEGGKNGEREVGGAQEYRGSRKRNRGLQDPQQLEGEGYEVGDLK